MGNNILKNKNGIIFGALDENSIAWKVAEKAKNEGANIILTNAPVALRMKKIYELSEKINAQVIGADVTIEEDIENLLNKSVEIFNGKIDFILHSVGMSPNIRKNIPYTELNYDFLHKTLDISAISLHKILSVANKQNCINDWGSIVTLTYNAAQRTYPSYSDMAHAKAMLESIVRQFGYYYGISNKVRINSVSQSPTKTTAGTGVSGFDNFFDFADKMSPLGNADANSCADLCVMLFSEYTKMITMQNIFNDGGYSSMGVSDLIIK
ncbi:MAG: SDR family oxidoreductase [Bacteroidales bacterium]|jgi:enoyl-[acyl-carrier protein] reductase I|nr:SDR family oxidoreductase [Bacteroidales bacterium]